MEVSYKFPDDVMVDPSLLTSRNHVWDTLDIIAEEDELDFYVPDSFWRFLRQRGYEAFQQEPSERPPILKYYSQYAEVPNLSDVVLPNNVSRFDAREYFSEHRELYYSLSQALPYSRRRPHTDGLRYQGQETQLVDSVFEELVFLLENSGWVSRIRRVVNDAIEAGVSFVEIDEDSVDEFLREHTKDRDQVKKDITKKLGKWIAVSTTGLATGFVGEPLWGLLSATSVKYGADATLLFVFDP